MKSRPSEAHFRTFNTSSSNDRNEPIQLADLPTRIEQRNHALTVKELAALLSVSPSNLYALCARNRAPHFLFGGSIRFDPVITARWLRHNTLDEL